MLLSHFLAGAVSFGFLSLDCFPALWRRTGDELFLAFALALALMAIGQAVIMIANGYLDEHSWAYLPRLGPFC